MKRLTRKKYQDFLNNIGLCLPARFFIIGGKYRKDKYVDMLRKYDPIAFEVGYNDKARHENEL